MVEAAGEVIGMRVFVTGVAGQLGCDVVYELLRRGHEVTGSDILHQVSLPVPYEALDITDEKAVNEIMDRCHPDAVVHCAAWTAVDAAEDADNQERVYRINVDGTKYIAAAAKAVDAKMVYISTDYVFDGTGDTPWEPDSAAYAPLNVYGQTKYEGEQMVAQLLQKYFIVRIAWAFGQTGNNFVRTMLQLAQNHSKLRVVNDQIGTPTYTYDLARLLVDMLGTDKYGYYHVTNEGKYISWYDFAVEIFRQAQVDVAVEPVSTKEYGLSKAKRPMNSRLDRSKLRSMGFEPLPDWKDALHRYLKQTARGNRG